jgi:hypothetical protein
MSDESDPKPTAEPTKSESDKSAAAAKVAAKDFANNANALFKGLDQKLQIYLIALAVTALCSLVFGAFSTKIKMGKGMPELAKVTSQLSGAQKSTSPSLLSLHSYKGAFGGKLAFLGALAGIGILVWSTVGKRKDSWIPLGLAGAAGVAALGILMTRLGMSSGGGNEMMKISINGTLLGWWLPFAAAIAATVVAVQRITKA